MTQTYILNTDDKARERLTLQHQLYADSSVNLLKEAGVIKGMKGLEIGCGSGAMTQELLKLVGNEGPLLSIDLSQEQINYVKKLAKDFANIRFKVWDVNRLSELGEQFDFIYCRMVLHHIADAHPVILQMKECLKPGGVIIFEEPSIFDSTFCYPSSNTYEQFAQLVRACFTSSKRDLDIAYRLELECLSCNLEVLHHSLFQPILRTPKQKLIYAMGLDDLTPQLLELKLATADEIKDLSGKLHELAYAKNNMSWIRMHQVIARF